MNRSKVVAAGAVCALMVSVTAPGQSLDVNDAAVYVSNVDGDTVSVIDPATNTVIAEVAVGREPRNLAASPDRTTVYVPNRHGDSVSVIDTDTNTVATTITDASFDEPYALAFSSDGSTVYVANKQGGGSSTGSVTVISTATRTVTTVIDDPCFSSPEGIATNPVSARAYVVNRGANTVCVIDTSNNTVNATVSVGGAPRYAVVTPDGSAVFVANNSGGNVTRISTADNSTTTILTGGSPRNMAISDDGSKVYVALQNSTIARIGVADNAVSTITFATLSSTYGVTVVPGTTDGYVTDESGDQVGVFSTATDSETVGTGLPITANFATPRAIASLGAAPPPPPPSSTTTTAPGASTTTAPTGSTSPIRTTPRFAG